VTGSIPLVLGGDFAQILPVICRGSRQATILACIRHSTIWSKLKILYLKKSMHVITSDANQVFLTFLKDMVCNSQLHGQL